MDDVVLGCGVVSALVKVEVTVGGVELVVRRSAAQRRTRRVPERVARPTPRPLGSGQVGPQRIAGSQSRPHRTDERRGRGGGMRAGAPTRGTTGRTRPTMVARRSLAVQCGRGPKPCKCARTAVAGWLRQPAGMPVTDRAIATRYETGPARARAQAPRRNPTPARSTPSHAQRNSQVWCGASPTSCAPAGRPASPRHTGSSRRVPGEVEQLRQPQRDVAHRSRAASPSAPSVRPAAGRHIGSVGRIRASAASSAASTSRAARRAGAARARSPRPARSGHLQPDAHVRRVVAAASAPASAPWNAAASASTVAR